MRRSSIPTLLIAFAVASFAATSAPAADDPWKSETFLADYTGLKLVPSAHGPDYLYVAPGVEEKMGRFDAVMVDQPEVAISPLSPYSSAKPDDLKAIAEFIRGAIVERVASRGFRVVEQPGESVLYLRVALTDLQLKKKRRNVLAYTPVGAVVHGIKAAVESVMKEVDIIDMVGQIEVADSRTGDVLAAMVTKRPAPADKAGGEKRERLTFEEFKGRVDEYSDRLACRIDNGRRPPARRVDCTDPAARNAPAGGSPDM